MVIPVPNEQPIRKQFVKIFSGAHYEVEKQLNNWHKEKFRSVDKILQNVEGQILTISIFYSTYTYAKKTKK